jgi:hypothetical protein
MEPVLMEYPDYSSGGYYGLESYLLRAEQMGADPIFLKIMRLRELTNEDKNAFINIYCDASFMRQMKGSHLPQYNHPTAGRELESFPAVDHNGYNQYPYGTKPKPSTLVVGKSYPARQEYQYGKVNDDRDPSDDELGGGKSRRRSNRKSRRKSRR